MGWCVFCGVQVLGIDVIELLIQLVSFDDRLMMYFKVMNEFVVYWIFDFEVDFLNYGFFGVCFRVVFVEQ